MPRPVLYYREGCHLCEAMAAWLQREWPAVAGDLEWRDVDASPAWREAYGDLIPVLALGDRVLCETLPDNAPLRALFGTATEPL